MKDAPQVLVAEDDVHIREGLIDTLESEGYEVTAVNDGQAAIEALDNGGIPYNLLLLDIMMPKVNGYDVCRHVRKSDEHIPIIMLTAKSQEIDKVLGLELGADDYVTKPFGIRELLARVAAALRRASLVSVDTEDLPDIFIFGEAEINRRMYQGKRDGKEFHLTATEMTMIEVFHGHPNEVLTREELMRLVYDQTYFGNSRTLDQHVAQLR